MFPKTCSSFTIKDLRRSGLSIKILQCKAVTGSAILCLKFHGNVLIKLQTIYQRLLKNCSIVSLCTKVVSFNKFRGIYRGKFGEISVTLLSTYHLLRMKHPHCEMKCYQLFYYICWMQQEKMSACLFFNPFFFSILK